MNIGQAKFRQRLLKALLASNCKFQVRQAGARQGKTISVCKNSLAKAKASARAKAKRSWRRYVSVRNVKTNATVFECRLGRCASISKAEQRARKIASWLD